MMLEAFHFSSKRKGEDQPPQPLSLISRLLFLIKPSAPPCKGMGEILGKKDPVKAGDGNLYHLLLFTRGQGVVEELPGR